MAIQLTDKQVKAGWQVVKFAEIAREARITTKTPLEDGLEYYVGLEHIDPQSLRIQRKGRITEDNPSFNKRFFSGQILFGRRRAYLKKAAVPDFAGICSGDITVIEAVPGKIIPGLLPFIVQSDMFFDWAVKNSAGGLSPRVKWKSLAEFEFPLPPLERQKEILEVLEKVNDAINKNVLALGACQILKRVLQNKLFLAPKKTSASINLEKLTVHITSGSRGWAKYYSETGDIFLRITNIQKDHIELDLSDVKYVKLPEKNSEGSRTLLQPKDILLTVTADIGLIGFVTPSSLATNTYINQHLAVIRPDQSTVDPRYLAYYLSSPIFYRYFLSLNGGGAKAGLSLKTIRKIPMKLPDLKKQRNISFILKNVDMGYVRLHENLSHLQSNLKQLTTNFLGINDRPRHCTLQRKNLIIQSGGLP